MKNRKETRTCVGCRKKDDEYSLIRFVNKQEVDLHYNKQGRGFYICKKEECLKKALKNRGLNIKLDDEKYNELRGVLFGDK